MGMINLSDHVCSKCEHMDRRDRTIHGILAERVRKYQKEAYARYKKYKWPPLGELRGGYEFEALVRWEKAHSPEIYAARSEHDHYTHRRPFIYREQKA